MLRLLRCCSEWLDFHTAIEIARYVPHDFGSSIHLQGGSAEIEREKILYMTTAGIAATRPIAVASSASAMPGATMAVCRLRLRDSDEAVHDPPHRAEQTDEGCCRADGGENAGAAIHRPARRGFDLLKACADPIPPCNRDRPTSEAAIGRSKNRGDAGPDLLSGVWLRSTFACAERSRCCARAAPREHQLDRLREPDGPGQHGRKGKADHYRFHDDVGRHEHAPRRQVARQLERDVGRTAAGPVAGGRPLGAAGRGLRSGRYDAAAEALFAQKCRARARTVATMAATMVRCL